MGNRNLEGPAHIDRYTPLNALLDDAANDARPFTALRVGAERYSAQTYIEPRLTAAGLKNYPLDPADDSGFLRCEPWGLARQMFAPHDLEIRQRANDRLELRYGEWDARRTVYLDKRSRPANQPASRLGYSIGRWETDALVIETTGVAANITAWQGEHSDQLGVVERYTKAKDGTLWLTATLTDPVSLREPLVLKKIWQRGARHEDLPVRGLQAGDRFQEKRAATMTRPAWLVVAALLMVSAKMASAHHSFAAEFDDSRTIQERSDYSAALTARGKSPSAFGERCIPHRGVAHRSNTPGILAFRALRSGRIVRLGATTDFHHGLLIRRLPGLRHPTRIGTISRAVAPRDGVAAFAAPTAVRDRARARV